MKYYGLSVEKKYLLSKDYLPMASAYWGPSPLPAGAVIIGGYSDDHRAGALIKLSFGYICGNAGAFSSVSEPPTTCPADVVGKASILPT
jgi:hypothetical protein